ncbi:hypothetical protein Jab_2c13990 [Janthinobacterium sp. HH01]|uniref:hypothetical protein n=1 Tax=Janthinobacterium sp. HH01 TaxID=1198452 RepID=UPI0002AEB08E|nr:hypothetical protein [Janthinobacterium sp. HH01]ELX09333.1 hypothetical protein Jab_2c13990 [Janthinobacterium sp. HH01]
MTTVLDPDLPLPALSLECDVRWQHVQRVLASPDFVKAPRMRALLCFLMLRMLGGMADSINEYAIGIEVFRRDVRDFDTSIDPVVRVQMGRLRERLAQYAARTAAASAWRIAIPPGSYVPVLTRGQSEQPAAGPTLQLAPLRVLTPGNGPAEFALGVGEELALLLFQRFGAAVAGAPHAYVLELSLRLEPDHARASIRLLEAGSGQALWLHRCDADGHAGIALQEALALAVCQDVADYLGRRDAPVSRQERWPPALSPSQSVGGWALPS